MGGLANSLVGPLFLCCYPLSAPCRWVRSSVSAFHYSPSYCLGSKMYALSGREYMLLSLIYADFAPPYTIDTLLFVSRYDVLCNNMSKSVCKR